MSAKARITLNFNARKYIFRDDRSLSIYFKDGRSPMQVKGNEAIEAFIEAYIKSPNEPTGQFCLFYRPNRGSGKNIYYFTVAGLTRLNYGKDSVSQLDVANSQDAREKLARALREGEFLE